MRNFNATAVERRVTIRESFFSQPMEAGWASEAIFFLWVEQVTVLEQPLELSLQISADGINWLDEGTTLPGGIPTTGHYFLKASHFGNWLRVALKTDRPIEVKLSVYLHLKE